MKKFLAFAAAATMGMGTFAMAATTGSVPVNLQVQPFVEVVVLDAGGVNWDVIGTGATPTTDMGVANGTHAKVQITANAAHDLAVTSSNGTFTASAGNVYAPLPGPWDAYQQVKFVYAADPTKYVGGSLYLRPVSSTGSAQAFQYWDGNTGNITLTSQAAGIYVWGVACGAAPQLNNFANGVALPGTYSTNAVITATVP